MVDAYCTSGAERTESQDILQTQHRRFQSSDKMTSASTDALASRFDDLLVDVVIDATAASGVEVGERTCEAKTAIVRGHRECDRELLLHWLP